MRRVVAFLILALIKVLCRIIWPGDFKWITSRPDDPFSKKVRMLVILNHTSLFEPIYFQALSFSYLWHLAGHISVPGADVTLMRPIVGTFYKLMVPNIAPITRKRDSSWDDYLASIDKESIVVIAPEGRMKRANGLDKDGRPMDVKGGIADILLRMDEGAVILCLSGGLHHIQVPGQTVPKFFRPVRMNLAYMDIKEYRDSLRELPVREQKLKIVQDLQDQVDHNCPPQLKSN